MNIQIFGSPKSQDTKKAIRFFKERSIKFQSIDMREKGMSKGEFNSVATAVGGYEKMLDQKCKDQDTLALIRYLTEDARVDKILENQQVLLLPIVRNGRQATLGYCPDVWKSWE